jgi:hypothetical protein
MTRLKFLLVDVFGESSRILQKTKLMSDPTYVRSSRQRKGPHHVSALYTSGCSFNLYVRRAKTNTPISSKLPFQVTYYPFLIIQQIAYFDILDTVCINQILAVLTLSCRTVDTYTLEPETSVFEVPELLFVECTRNATTVRRSL